MTLDDVERLFVHWRKLPPLRMLFAAAYGFKPADDKVAEAPKYMTADDMRRLMAMTGGRIPGM